MHQPILTHSPLHETIDTRFSHKLAWYEEFFRNTRQRILTLAFFTDDTTESLRKHKLRSIDDYSFFLSYNIQFQKELLRHNSSALQELWEQFLAEIREESPDDTVSYNAFAALLELRNQEITELARKTKLALTYFRLLTYPH